MPRVKIATARNG